MSRNLDAKLARGFGTKFAVAYRSEGEAVMGCPLYSSDGNHMLELIAEMVTRGFDVHTSIGLVDVHAQAVRLIRVGREIKDLTIGTGQANTLPLAVALAAHKAIYGEDFTDA